ncbi:hypothetical protein C8R46DRAFT_1214518 [Mycena filopes]|nr:hypothetical protein C8R46DRAFT_1214518 [Mycena filopes]
MLHFSSCQRRARDVLKTFLDHHTTCLKAVLRRKNKTTPNFTRAGLDPEQIKEINTAVTLGPTVQISDTLSINMTSSSDSASSLQSSISSNLSRGASSATLDWSELLGSDWQGSSTSTSTATTSEDSEDSDSMPDLHLAGYSDSDSDSVTLDRSSNASSTASSGEDGDDEGGWGDDMDIEDEAGPDAITGGKHNVTCHWGIRQACVASLLRLRSGLGRA